jgi:hypothetical protein
MGKRVVIAGGGIVALKVLAAPLAASGTARQRFAREARAAMGAVLGMEPPFETVLMRRPGSTLKRPTCPHGAQAPRPQEAERGSVRQAVVPVALAESGWIAATAAK